MERQIERGARDRGEREVEVERRRVRGKENRQNKDIS